MDAYSTFPYVIEMSSTMSAARDKALTSVFCIEGLPEAIVSDNGPQFTLSEFEQFCVNNGIEHVTTAPFHPQSNGEAERFVRTFKCQMLKLTTKLSKHDALITF